MIHFCSTWLKLDSTLDFWQLNFRACSESSQLPTTESTIEFTNNSSSDCYSSIYTKSHTTRTHILLYINLRFCFQGQQVFGRVEVVGNRFGSYVVLLSREDGVYVWRPFLVNQGFRSRLCFCADLFCMSKANIKDVVAWLLSGAGLFE